jgi:hypothetical protein
MLTMTTSFVIASVLGAAMAGFSAVSILRHAAWVVEPLTEYGVPRSWWPWLGAAKAAGALGLLVGLAVPPVGVVAAIGLVLYFTGAVVTVLHARSYAHVAFPLVYMAPAVGLLVAA